MIRLIQIYRKGALVLTILLFLLSKLIGQVSSSQKAPANIDAISPFEKQDVAKSIQPILAIECWTLFSKALENSEFECPDRTDIMFRRFRMGAKGQPYSWLSYSFQLNIDRFGEDIYTPVNGAYKGIGLWNAYITAKLLKASEILNLHAGYFWAGISREFITSPYAVGSLDKTRANWFLRHFITGKGNGIESGIGLGGIKNGKNIGVSYRLGVYEPAAYASVEYADKLYTGRIAITLGDAEQQSYKYMIVGNSWSKRSGITLGAGGSTQRNGAISDTSYFEYSKAYGTDILIEHKGLRIEGEYFMFTRGSGSKPQFDGNQYHIRVGYSFLILNKYFEPAFCYDRYEGGGNKELYKYIGVDRTFDIGVNWYMNKDKLKLALHYIVQEGNISKSGDYFGFVLQFKL